MKFILTKTLIEQTGNIVLARDLTTQGHKSYIGVPKPEDIFNVEGDYKNEVALGYNNRKLYFDFDKALDVQQLDVEHGAPIIENDFIQDMNEVLIASVDALFGAVLNPDNIVYTNSSISSKASYHIIIPGFNTSVDNLKILYGVVSKTLGEKNPVYINCLDSAVYGTNQCFRLLGCCKMGKNNKKQLITNHNPADTLISIYEGDTSYELHLKPSIQQKIDEKKQHIESNKMDEMAVNPSVLRDIVMNINYDRADKFDYWMKVCLALGHENAGLDVALEFSKRSPKFNPVMAEKLYNRGEANRDSNSKRLITKASLLAMLKEDNIDKFNEIIKIDFKTASAGLSPNEIKDMIEEHIESEKIKADETQEQKIARWLENPEYHFYHKVSEPKKALNYMYMKNRRLHKKINKFSKTEDIDNIKTYYAEHMEAYDKEAKTQVIKAEKGTGKTYALEQYVKDTNPEYCLFISFRRSLSSEIIKRLSKYGFVNYSDIKGAIDNKHKRVIIQVESLHRIRWNKRCDLLVCDEIESTRSQFFSETCRLRNACIEKYEMLLESSKQAILMDADISANTINHIKQTRHGIIHYVENTYKKVQSKFKEFYTSKQDKMFSKLCEALDKGEKIVIATNRSVEFMEAVKHQINIKYPDLKIQLFNSKTIRNEAVADELADTDKLKKYDVVMYSPTISAGVSIEYEHFNKCFCYFVNNGKVNSMRQMINRVRKFSTNEFYFCLQTYGGSSKPQDIETMEKYISSNRFIDKPEFIFSKEKYDGTRLYPYKNAGYWLWLYNETEKNRDKNMFIFNFLREQHHAGIGSMEWIPDQTDQTEQKPQPAPKITEEDIKSATTNLKYDKIIAIATANPINDTQKEDIAKRLSEEKTVSDDEIFSLKRKNLLNHYNFSERHINPLFVEIYGEKTVKTAYTNRQKLLKGLKSVCDDESRQFNGLFTDMTNVQDDLKKKYVSLKLVIGTELIKICGFKGLYDTKTRTKAQIEKGFKKHQKLLKDKINDICDVLGKPTRRRPDVDKWMFRSKIDFVNSALSDVLQLKIKQTGHRTDIYGIEGIDMYKWEDKPALFEKNYGFI